MHEHVKIYYKNVDRGLQRQNLDSATNNVFEFMKQDPCLVHGLDFENPITAEYVRALQPDNEFAKLIKHLDHLIELRKDTREEQADSFGAVAPSADLIKKQTRLNFEKTKNAISKMKLIAAMSNIKNEK